ncbi:MAG: sorbosone dehydrogenase family protein [Rhodospirillaceae bacterium]|nr:sorbosone dehydrogenase family protein [Rhodospirillaceae bacterium]
MLPATLLAAGGAVADEAPGTRIQVDPASLPPPYATDAVAFQPGWVPAPQPLPFRLPAGFAVNVFVEDLRDARWLAVAPNGDVFLAEPDVGRVTLLRDADGDGRAEVRHTFADGFRRPHGLAFQGDWLYVADTERVWRLPWHAGDAKAAGPPEPVTAPGALGSASGHWTRNLAFSPDGSRLFVAIGSASNIGRDPAPRATVQSFAADGSDQKTFASGLRNPVGIAFYPGTEDLYVVVNERDGLGDGLVPDYLTRLEEGGFYGWPYSYIGSHPQPGLEGPKDLVDRAIVPDLLFHSHSAPLGLVFYEGAQFPPDYRGDAFVALHGSWNSSRPVGYMVVRVPFENGRPAGWYEPFLTGFLVDGGGSVFGRPVGLAVAADGSLLVADDMAGVVWRVSYAGR